MKLYKVLKNGSSCHGGNLTWSLPADGKPGAWHEETSVELCKRGLHLTSYPETWWVSGCQVYEAEAEGPVEGEGTTKVVCKRARLIRQVSLAEYAADRRVSVRRVVRA